MSPPVVADAAMGACSGARCRDMPNRVVLHRARPAATTHGAVSCRVWPRDVMPCRAMPHHAIPRHAMPIPRNAATHHARLHHAVPHGKARCGVKLYDTAHHIILCDSMPHPAMPCCATHCPAALWPTMPCPGCSWGRRDSSRQLLGIHYGMPTLVTSQL